MQTHAHEPDVLPASPPGPDASRFFGIGTAIASPRELDAAGFRAAQRAVPTPFGAIACFEQGQGDAALFLHGFPLNGFHWRGVIGRLSGYRRCLAPDLLGLGYTDVAPSQDLSPVAQADMLVAVLDACGITDADIVANDSGTMVAQLLAIRHPGRVRSLLLTNGDSEIECPPAGLMPVIELARAGRFAAEWLVPWLWDKAAARAPTGLAGLAYTHAENLTDEAIEMYLRPLVANPERTNAFAVALADNPLVGTADALRRCVVPARIVWGTGDRTFSTAGAEHLHGVLGGSRGIRWVPQANLFFPEEYPDLMAEEALGLWDLG